MDRLLPAAGAARSRGARARGRARRLRRERAQRRLGVGPLAGRGRHPRPAPRAHRHPGPPRRAARHRRRGRPGRRRGRVRLAASSRAGRWSWRAPPRRRPGPGSPPRTRRRGTTARSGWMPPPPASGSTSPERVERPSRRTAPGCTRAGWSTGWPPPCGGSVAASSRERRWRAPPTGSWCSPTATGSRPAHVVVATEGWTGTLAGLTRRVAPVYSLMVATEPIDDDRWSRIGLAGREVFADHGHVVIYGQRTDDGRIAFGGRGAPYHWGIDDPTRVRRGAGGLRRPALDAARPAPPARRRRVHARLGRPARHRPRLAPVGHLGPGDPHRTGGRLRRRRRGGEQPGRAHAGRPGARSRPRRSPPCRGSGTARRAGSTSPCAGWA